MVILLTSIIVCAAIAVVAAVYYNHRGQKGPRCMGTPKGYFIHVSFIDKYVEVIACYDDDSTATVKRFHYDKYSYDDFAFAKREAEELLEKLEEK